MALTLVDANVYYYKYVGFPKFIVGLIQTIKDLPKALFCV